MSSRGSVAGEAEDVDELVLDRSSFGEHAVGSGPAALALVEHSMVSLIPARTDTSSGAFGARRRGLTNNEAFDPHWKFGQANRLYAQANAAGGAQTGPTNSPRTSARRPAAQTQAAGRASQPAPRAMRTDGAARLAATLPCWVMRLGYTTAFASPGVRFTFVKVTSLAYDLSLRRKQEG
jgi:hypothetical protein